MEYVAEPLSDWFFWFFLIGALCTSVTWLVFARLSMARIKRKLKDGGAADLVPWDGISGGIVFIAHAIALPERYALKINRLIDVRLVRAHAQPKDRVLAVLFLLLADTWIGVSLIAMIFGWDKPFMG
jgi:hypothetical protein